MENESNLEADLLEADLKVKFLTWASITISLVAETEASHDRELAQSIQNLAGRLREFAIVIAARESEPTDSGSRAD